MLLRRAGIVIVLLLAASRAESQKPPPIGDDETPHSKPPPLGTMEPGRPAPYGARMRPSPGGDVRPFASGSGFMVADGRALTNNHVAGDCARVVARNSDGQRVETRLLAADAGRDLALLAAPPGFAPPLTFRDGPAVSRGESIVTYGFPLTGLLSSGPTLTTGSISALSGLRDTPLHFTISAPVQPGNSGGPLLDAQGHVIGVVVAKLNAARIAEMTGGDIPQNVNFAIKGQEALEFLHARDVRPATAESGGPELGAAAVGRIADPSTLFLQCYR